MSQDVDFTKTPLLSFRAIILTFLATFFTLFHPQARGQSPAKEETIKIINEIMGPGSRLTWEQGALIVTLYNTSDKITRQDRVSPEALDLTIFHDEENYLLCIPCVTGRQQCVNRTLPSTQRKRTLNSLDVPVKDTREFYLLMRAFEHLIRLTSENDYKAEVDFE